MCRADRQRHVESKPREIRFGNPRAVDADALAHVLQVRRNVELDEIEGSNGRNPDVLVDIDSLRRESVGDLSIGVALEEHGANAIPNCFGKVGNFAGVLALADDPRKRGR